MSRITAEDAFRALAKWGEERAAIHVQMLRPAKKMGGQPAATVATLSEVLPHSQNVLLTLRDENGEDVGVTVSLEGAAWDTGGAADTKWLRFLVATFPNGNRYEFGERAEGVSQ